MRAFLSVFIIHASAEDSLMQFEKSSDFAHSHEQGNARSHTERMKQNTEAMALEWKNILLNIAKSGSWENPATGNPWVPNKTGVLQPVEQVINSMQEELSEQKNLNTYIMGNHSADIRTCNSVMDNGIKSSGVSDLQSFQGARSTHSGCRSDEIKQIGYMEANCSTFDSMSKVTCNKEQDWFAALDEKKSGVGSLQAIVDQAAVCKSDIGKTKSIADDCDNKQTTFNDAFCTYRCTVDTICGTHAKCYAQAVDYYGKAKTSITQLEKEQKAIYRTLERIRCYLDLLIEKADGSMPTAEAIAKCEEKTPLDDSSLTVDYDKPAAAATCYGHASLVDGSYGGAQLTATSPPSWPDFKVKELDVLSNTHSQLSAAVGCVSCDQA